MTKKVKKLRRVCLRNPVKIDAAPKYSIVETLKQQFLFVPSIRKDCYLVHILVLMSRATSMIFTRTCKDTSTLASFLRTLGLRAIPINGHMTQSNRLGALNKFKSEECNILVCTDVASRGLDIPFVDLVMNYNIPANPKDYIHRVGRTARAGRSWLAISLVDQYTMVFFKLIEEHIGGKDYKIPEFCAEKEEVLQLMERVTEAKRISEMLNKESGTKRKGRGHDEEEDIGKYLGIRNKFKKRMK